MLVLARLLKDNTREFIQPYSMQDGIARFQVQLPVCS